MKSKTIFANAFMLVFVMICASCNKKAVSPTIKTLDVVEITENSAKCGGDITENGMAFIKQRGVCWSSTNLQPTIADSKTTDGNGDGVFQTTIGGLDANTTYHIRAYAKNEVDVSYGETKTFTTKDFQMFKPTVSTSNVSNISKTSATCGGTVTADGNSLVTAKGVCWSESENPTVSDSHTNDGKGIGSFQSSITGLAAGTRYYVRSYATNSVGTTYGETKSFETASDGTVTPLSDYIGTYSVTAYNWDLETYESWSGTRISTYQSDEMTWVLVEGICWGEGNSYLHAVGQYDESTGAIHLYGGWYRTNITFYFFDEPDIYYHSVLWPIYALDTDDTFYYIEDGHGYQDSPEMYLAKNSDGTYSLTGADYNDSNGRKATGFCLTYYNVSDDTYSGRFQAFTHYTLTKTSKGADGITDNSEPAKVLKAPHDTDNQRKKFNGLDYKNILKYGR